MCVCVRVCVCVSAARAAILDLATATVMSSCTSSYSVFECASLIPNYMMSTLLLSGRCILICRVTRLKRVFVCVCVLLVKLMLCLSYLSTASERNILCSPLRKPLHRKKRCVTKL